MKHICSPGITEHGSSQVGCKCSYDIFYETFFYFHVCLEKRENFSCTPLAKKKKITTTKKLRRGILAASS